MDYSWNSHKIAMRYGYKIEDYSLWSDLIRLLEKNGRDTRSTKYICPDNLRAEHDYWLNKPTTPEERRIKAEQMRLTKRKVADFYKNKSCYFGIIISDNDIEVIRLIICLRDIDMPIKNIRDYMQLYVQGDSTIEERRALMWQYCDFVENKIKKTIETLKFTTEKIACFDEVVEDILAQRKSIYF